MTSQTGTIHLLCPLRACVYVCEWEWVCKTRIFVAIFQYLIQCGCPTLTQFHLDLKSESLSLFLLLKANWQDVWPKVWSLDVLFFKAKLQDVWPKTWWLDVLRTKEVIVLGITSNHCKDVICPPLSALAIKGVWEISSRLWQYSPRALLILSSVSSFLNPPFPIQVLYHRSAGPQQPGRLNWCFLGHSPYCA